MGLKVNNSSDTDGSNTDSCHASEKFADGIKQGFGRQEFHGGHGGLTVTSSLKLVDICGACCRPKHALLLIQIKATCAVYHWCNLTKQICVSLTGLTCNATFADAQHPMHRSHQRCSALTAPCLHIDSLLTLLQCASGTHGMLHPSTNVVAD